MISLKKIISWILAIMLMLFMSACSTENTETTMPPTIDPPGNSGPSKPTMKEPPKLTVSFGPGDSFDAATGTYGWRYDNGDGTMSGIEADSPHPLDLMDHLTPLETTVDMLELQFEVQPQSISVRCWNDSQWGNTGAESQKASLSGNLLELKEGGFIYEVEATWSGENLAAEGTVHYVFYVIKHSVQYAHDHSLADTPQTVENPVTGYCGNTLTTIILDGKEYTFMGSDSVNLTDTLINLEYDPALVCKCLPDFYVETEFGTTYGVSWSGYARCDEGQANLTEEQLDQIRSIVDNQT